MAVMADCMGAGLGEERSFGYARMSLARLALRTHQTELNRRAHAATQQRQKRWFVSWAARVRRARGAGGHPVAHQECGLGMGYIYSCGVHYLSWSCPSDVRLALRARHRQRVEMMARLARSISASQRSRPAPEGPDCADSRLQMEPSYARPETLSSSYSTMPPLAMQTIKRSNDQAMLPSVESRSPPP
jgi:hypothetical protein